MIFLSIGSNLSSKFGNRFDNINNAIKFLISNEVLPIKISNFFETPSYPNKKNPKFINVALEVKFNQSPTLLLKKITYVEKKMQRLRAKRNEPRTCDIDIIDFKKMKIDSAKIILPHPRAHSRNFVLYPMYEICPNWIHPLNNKKIDILIKNLTQTSRNEITRLGKSAILDL